MPKSTQEQLRFHPLNGKTVRADFNGGELSSDFGALLLREISSHFYKAGKIYDPNRYLQDG